MHKSVDSNIVLLYYSTQIDTPSSDGYVFHKKILSAFMSRCSFLFFEHNAGGGVNDKAHRLPKAVLRGASSTAFSVLLGEC